ncbi:DELTA-thalatoxin-Avl2a-like [Nematostella vectensis]|uniref:DELTA-thalatoxin-Avl2a-like n=1 Tax=Nematostella vectensis TaxID=45351 RepID=UPI002076FCF6|nr:DELTA-thalatoxin-Avl2a-like [Nematostella vectensis]
MLPALVVLLLGVALVISQDPPKITDYGPLGQTFNVVRRDLISKRLPSTGPTMAHPFPKDCYRVNGLDIRTNNMRYFDNTREVYSFLNRFTRFSSLLPYRFTLKASLRAVTDGLSASSKQVKGLVVYVEDQSAQTTLSKQCLQKITFTNNFLEDFRKLPTKITNAEPASSWSDYTRFVKKYGTHMVTSVVFGASIHSYSFSRSTKPYTQLDFLLKECTTVKGPIATEIPNACLGLTDKGKVSGLEMNHRVLVRGGTVETRSKLIYSREKDLVKKFLEEGRKEPSPISYEFVEIWNILKGSLSDSADLIRVRILEQYITGYEAFGCHPQIISRFKVRMFFHHPYSDPNNPTFMCLLMDPGCNDNEDCHYSFFEGCSCNGASCIENRMESFEDGTNKMIAYAWKGGWRDVAHGCSYQGVPTECHCDRKPGFSVIWQRKGLHSHKTSRDSESGNGEQEGIEDE